MERTLHIIPGASESVGGFGSPPRSTYRHFRWRGGSKSTSSFFDSLKSQDLGLRIGKNLVREAQDSYFLNEDFATIYLEEFFTQFLIFWPKLLLGHVMELNP